MMTRQEKDRLESVLQTALNQCDFHQARYDENYNEMTFASFEIHFNAVEVLHSKFYNAFDVLFPELTEDDKPIYRARADQFLAKYYDLLEKLNEGKHLRTREAEAAKEKPEARGGSALKCPRIPLPEFDGTTEKWIKFRDLFESLVHNNNTLSDIEKFQYLEMSMKIPSSQSNILSSFKVNAKDYEAAWKAVCDRYHDTRKILSCHLTSLFSVKKMTSATASELRKLIDGFAPNLSSLNQMGYVVGECDDFSNLFIVHMVVHRLHEETLKDWRKFNIDNVDDTATWDQLHAFLVAQWRSLDDVQTKKVNQKAPEVKPVAKQHKSYINNNSNRSVDVCCVLCSESHFLWSCSKFIQMPMDDRQKTVREHKLCLNCLNKGHQHRDCKSKHRCKTCQKSHHTLLHFDKSITPRPPVDNRSRTSNGHSSLSPDATLFEPFVMNKKVNAHVESQNSMTSFSKMFVAKRQTLLSTVSLQVVDANGVLQLGRALLDSGSDANIITTSFANKLQLKLINTFIPLTGVNEKTSVIRHKTETTVLSRYGPYEKKLEFSVLASITGNIPSQYLDVRELNIPNEYFIADPLFNQPAKVDMLLSADVFYDALLSDKLQLVNGPMLIHTKFGWIIGGSTTSQRPRNSALLSCFTQETRTGDNEIDERLDKFFRFEDFESASSTLTPEEKFCEDLYAKTTTRGDDGRYIVHLPFKSNVGQLGTNFSNAMRQNYSQESRRQKNEEINKLYVDYIEEYISSGHMQEVAPVPGSFGHYLPHHGVVKMSSTSTKLRPVCNASSCSETGLSLNDTLCVGPMVQPESFDILMRFREKKFVIMGDITKMYRQIWIHPSHRKFLRILWRSNPTSDSIRHYQLNTVTFGTSSAPFLATRTIRQIALDYKDDFPAASAVVDNSFYVDDLLFGTDDVEAGLRLRDQIRFMMAKSGMKLCKLMSNTEALMAGLPKKDIEVYDDEDNSIAKALGIVYHPIRDDFSYKLKPMKEGVITKASVLSEIASVYDPIGWLGPVILKAKLFMKGLWMMKLKWDQELPEDVQHEWNEFREHFHCLNQVRIRRHCVISNQVVVELHGFCDASIVAYGAVIYARSHDECGNIQTSLICAKSRVAPKNQKTLARLELCGATLLSKLVTRTISILSVTIEEVTLWCDSTIVLSWLAIPSNRLQTFVGNRVSIVQELTHTFMWKHIRGSDNPADIISRGLQPQEIEKCDRWWNGPSFFLLPKLLWPESIITLNEEDPEIVQEMKKTCSMMKPDDMFHYIETRFSRPRILINVIGTMRRFIFNAQKDAVKLIGPLSIDEKDQSEMFIIRVLQSNFFPQECQILRKERDRIQEENVQGQIHQISRKSTIVQLAPFMDKEGILRVGGRIHASLELTFDQKHQIILPNCHFTTILIRDLHKKHLHPGPTAMLSFVKEKYWPLKGKSIIRRVTHQCITCFRVKPTDINQFMADLPLARVTMTQPFVNTAVDYAGYYNIRTSITRNTSSTKAYVALFKCMCTGAIHLDLVSDLSAQAFIAVLDRFVSRRGLCEELFTDNATCFEGADNELKRIINDMDEDVKQYCNEQSIKWNFTTPRAPHAGGIYESGIKSMKHHLKRVMDDKLYTFEQFCTILCKVEAVLNSRPLTPMSEDPRDMRVLTPGHFLIGRSFIAKPEKNHMNVKSNRLKSWEGLQQVQQQFWSQWYHDYLHEHQTRPKNFREKFEFAVGDMVLVKEPNLPPLKWLFGRIIKLFPGKDKVVRNVKVVTKHGEKDRHVKYLCLLPFEKETSEPGESVPAGI